MEEGMSQYIPPTSDISNVIEPERKDDRKTKDICQCICQCISEFCQCVSKNGKKICQCIAKMMIIIATIGSIVFIYTYVNIILSDERDECNMNSANKKQAVEIFKKDVWYVFRFNGHECSAPADESLIGTTNGTTMIVYVSDNLKHCALKKESISECDNDYVLFNILYSIFGMVITVILVMTICVNFWYPCTGKFCVYEYYCCYCCYCCGYDGPCKWNCYLCDDK